MRNPEEDPPKRTRVADLFARHYPELLRFIRRRIRRRADTRDVAHEVYVKLTQLPADYPFEDVRAYMLTVAANILHRAWKRDQVVVFDSDVMNEAADNKLSDHASSPEAQSARLDIERVTRILNRQEREVLLLKMRGHTVEEIAERTSLTYDQVRRLILRINIVIRKKW